MPTETTPILSSPPKGEYAPRKPGDVRGPCPLVNCLANHGYISRTGKDIRASELNAAMRVIGLSRGLGAIFAEPIFNEYMDPKEAYLHKKQGFFAKFWAFLMWPWSILSMFGLRKHGQFNKDGEKVISLDDLAQPGVIEHDISLTRRDHQQKQGNCERQEDLTNDLLNCSRDGQKITMQDFADLRKRRIQRQLEDNPDVNYTAKAHRTGCTEIALILEVFGNGKDIPCSYAKAIFEEERLPVKEGWFKRRWLSFKTPEGWAFNRWFPLFTIQMVWTRNAVMKAVGLQV